MDNLSFNSYNQIDPQDRRVSRQKVKPISYSNNKSPPLVAQNGKMVSMKEKEVESSYYSESDQERKEEEPFDYKKFFEEAKGKPPLKNQDIKDSSPLVSVKEKNTDKDKIKGVMDILKPNFKSVFTNFFRFKKDQKIKPQNIIIIPE